MSDRPEIEKQLLSALEVQRADKKYRRFMKVYPLIEELEKEGYNKESITELVNEGGLDITYQTLRTYTLRCRKDIAQQKPDSANKAFTQDKPAKQEKPVENEKVGGNPPPAVEHEEPERQTANNPSLDDVLNARQRDADGSTDRYLMAQRPLRNKGTRK